MLLMADKSTSNTETEQISIRVPVKLLDRLERIGEPYGTKRSVLINRAIEEFVARHHQQQPAQSRR